MNAISLYEAYAKVDPNVCCHRRIPIPVLSSISKLSLPPEESVYVLKCMESAYGDVLLLFHDVNANLE